MKYDFNIKQIKIKNSYLRFIKKKIKSIKYKKKEYFRLIFFALIHHFIIKISFIYIKKSI